MNVILLMHDLTRFLTISLSGELSTLLLRNYDQKRKLKEIALRTLEDARWSIPLAVNQSTINIFICITEQYLYDNIQTLSSPAE